MKHLGMLMLTTFAATALTVSDFADAARLGGGRSIGAQRQSIAPQRPAAVCAIWWRRALALPQAPSQGASGPL